MRNKMKSFRTYIQENDYDKKRQLGIDEHMRIAKNLNQNGGKVYRLLMLNSIDEFDKEHIGIAWVADSSWFDKTLGYLVIYGRGKHRNKKPFLVTAEIPPEQINIQSTERNIKQYFSEHEITLNYHPKFVSINIEPFIRKKL
jgi:hypothetical protein